MINKDTVNQCYEAIKNCNGEEIKEVIGGIPFQNLISLSLIIQKKLHDDFFNIYDQVEKDSDKLN